MSLIRRAWRHLTYRDMPRLGGVTYADLHQQQQDPNDETLLVYPETLQVQSTTIIRRTPRRSS